MKKNFFFLLLLPTIFFVAFTPQFVSAHAHYTYHIGSKMYQFTIGSLNEPLVIDDKSGIDLTINEGGVMPAGEHEHTSATETAVEGLEKTLKVEMIQGDQKKTMDLAAAWGKPGSYSSVFYPTVPGVFTYRVFGTINDIPVDLSFSCNPEGHVSLPEDTNVVQISDNVTQFLKRGSFSCPKPKSDFGFPEASSSIHDLADEKNVSNEPLPIAGVVLGLLGLVFGGAAWLKTRG